MNANAENTTMRMALEDLPKSLQQQAKKKLAQGKPQAQPAPKESAGEAQLRLQLIASETPLGAAEYQFREDRKWRFDRAWPEHKLAVEIEGITHDGGRHQRPAGFIKDCEKYEAALLDGWQVYRVPPAWIKSGRALRVIQQLLGVSDGCVS